MRTFLYRHIQVRGFTLIEILVVLVILGVAISSISYGLGALRDRDEELALKRLHWILEATAERARTRGQQIAFELLSDGYRFSLQNTDGRWVAFESPPVFNEHIFPNNLTWGELRIEGRREDRIVFGIRSTRFELTVQTPNGVIRFIGRPSGLVDQLNSSTSKQ